jgi:hypothetical protein
MIGVVDERVDDEWGNVAWDLWKNVGWNGKNGNEKG